MIYAFNFTCERDQALSELMQETLIKYGAPNIAMIRPTMTGGRKYNNYGNGSGWPASMMKLDELSYIVENFEVQDNDFILSVDSDVVFTSGKVFEYVKPDYGIIGILGQQPWNTKFGKWAHLSGCLIFIRGDIAKKMAELTDEELHMIRYTEFKPYGITENEDVVLSYLANKCGANVFDLSTVPDLTSGDFEGDLSPYVKDPCDVEFCSCQYEIGKGFKCFSPHIKMKSFYHLNYCPTEFLGESVTGKWDIPNVLKIKGIQL